MLSKSVNQSLAQDAADSLIPQLTNQLRGIARASNWPSDVIDQMNVVFEGGQLVVDYPEGIRTKVEDIEYGTMEQIPNAAIRPFVARSSEALKSILESLVVSTLVDEIGVFNG